MSSSVTLKWYGHACFAITKDGYTVAIDPYDSGVPGYNPLSLTVDEVVSTHGHHDHNYFEAVTIKKSGIESPFKIEKLESFHDNEGGALRGKNDILIFETEGLKIVHLGDLGHILTPQQQSKLAGADILMIPVGGHFTIDAVEAKVVIDQIKPKIIIPMHYRFNSHGFDVISTIDGFLDSVGDMNIVNVGGDTIEITKDTESAVMVLGCD